MKKRKNEFEEIELLKQKYRHQIAQQELKIKSGFSELSDNLTGAALFSRVRDNLFTGSGFAFKLGFLAVSLLRKKIAGRKRKSK